MTVAELRAALAHYPEGREVVTTGSGRVLAVLAVVSAVDDLGAPLVVLYVEGSADSDLLPVDLVQ